jgi:hypothetical protein
MYHAWDTYEMHVQFQSGNLKGRDKLGDLSVGGRIILRCILEEWDVIMWNGFLCSDGGFF